MMVLLIMLMTVVMMSCAMAADEPTVYTSGEYKYVLLEDGTAEITKYTGYTRTLTIPEQLDGHSVTAIGYETFSRCRRLTFTVPRDSYAEQYCIDNNLSYTYPDANDWLLN